MRALAVVCALALATGTGEHAEERSHVDSTSTLVLLDGRRVSSHEAFRCGVKVAEHLLRNSETRCMGRLCNRCLVRPSFLLQCTTRKGCR